MPDYKREYTEYLEKLHELFPKHHPWSFKDFVKYCDFLEDIKKYGWKQLSQLALEQPHYEGR